MSRTFYPTLVRLTTFLLFLPSALIFLVQCVSTNPEKSLGLETVPPGKAIVLVSVTQTTLPPDDLTLTLGEGSEVMLQAGAINRLTVDPGWMRFQLTGLPQPDNNAMLRYRVDAGQLYRYALIERTAEATADTTTGGQPPESHFVIVTSTPDAYEQLLLADELPVVDVHP